MDKQRSGIFSRSKEIFALIQFNFLHLLFLKHSIPLPAPLLFIPEVFFCLTESSPCWGFPI